MTTPLFAPEADTLAAQLPDIGDGLSARLAELSRDASAECCEAVSIHLRGVQAYVDRLREASRRKLTENAAQAA